MFDVDFTELLVIFVVALVVLGPKRLPGLVSSVGRWIGKARAMTRQFREQLESEVRFEEFTRTGGSQSSRPPGNYPPPPPEFGGEPMTSDTASDATGEAAAEATTEAPADPGSSIPADHPSHLDLSDTSDLPPGEPPHERTP